MAGKPWNRQPNEGAKAYAAFQRYYTLPASVRSIDAAWKDATALPQENNGIRAPKGWAIWSTRHDWVARALAYDEHLAELDRLEIERRRREQRELEWQIAKAGLELVRDALPAATQFLRSQRRTIPARDGQPEREIVTLSFDVTGLAAASERFGKQGRLSNDEPTDNLNLSGAALDAAILRGLAVLADRGETGAIEADSTTPDADGPALLGMDEMPE